MLLFLDACALAKRYLHEGESTRRMRQITGRFERWGGFIAIGAADAVHLATALALLTQATPGERLVFVTADRGLADAARKSGLTVFNPLLQRPEDLEAIGERD